MKYAICLRSFYPYITEGHKYKVLEYGKSNNSYADLVRIKSDSGFEIVLHATRFKFTED